MLRADEPTLTDWLFYRLQQVQPLPPPIAPVDETAAVNGFDVLDWQDCDYPRGVPNVERPSACLKPVTK